MLQRRPAQPVQLLDRKKSPSLRYHRQILKYKGRIPGLQQLLFYPFFFHGSVLGLLDRLSLLPQKKRLPESPAFPAALCQLCLQSQPGRLSHGKVSGSLDGDLHILVPIRPVKEIKIGRIPGPKRRFFL